MLHLVGSSVLLYLIDDARSNKNQVYVMLLFCYFYFGCPRFVVDRGVNKLWSGRSGFESWQETGVFTISKISSLILVPKQRPIQWVPDNFSGVNRPKLEIGHSCLVPDSRMSGSMLFSFLYVCMTWRVRALPFTFIPVFRNLVKTKNKNLIL